MSIQLSFKLLSRIMAHCSKREKSKAQAKPQVAPITEVHRFISECLCTLGVQKNKACIFADSLVAADYRGIYSHGLNRLENYIKDIKEKICDANADPVIAMECASTAAVCGNNGLGAVIGVFCMDLAVQKAKETGIGMVVTNGSNHFGVNMFFAERATDQGCIGLAFTNTSPVMVPTGAKDVCLGTNPLALVAPGACRDRLVIDMATTAVAVGKIELYRKRKQNIPLGWALDENGKQTTDPEVAMKNKKLMPLGGEQSHKGTALALLVECLSGIIADSAYGPNVRSWGTKPPKPANLGHGFIAIDPKKFLPGFQERLSDLMNRLRCLTPASPDNPVLVPGDIENEIKKKTDEQGGVIYSPHNLEMVTRLSQELGIKPIQFLEESC